jgi:hypothetical protein
MLSEANILQVNFGNFDASSGTATLPSGTSEGSAVLLVARSASAPGGLNVPAGFEQDITPISLGGAALHAWRRKNCAVGESSWPISLQAQIADLVLWFAYEVTDLDLTEPLDQWATHGATGVTSVSTGTTPQTNADDIMCMAIHATNTVTTISGWTNGFDVIPGEFQSQNAGADGQEAMSVQRLYPGVAGQYECTATLGASVTAMGAMIAYRAVGELPVDPGGEVMS